MPSVFVSYSTQNRDFAFRLATDLKAAAIPVWFDQWEVKVGDSIVEKINDGISTSDYLIVVISRASLQSRWVREELSAAKTIEIDRNGVFILPVLIEDCKLPPMLASKRYADFRHSYSVGLADLFNVFGTTHATESPSERYLLLEGEWKKQIYAINDAVIMMTALRKDKRRKAFILSEEFTNDNLNSLAIKIRDAVDVYRALRPLEKSAVLAERMDGTAYFLAILARAHDVELMAWQNRYKKLVDVGLGVYLVLAASQASLGASKEAIWTFRKSIRLVMALIEPWEDALFRLTYALSRTIAYLNVAPEQDLAVDLITCRDRSFLQNRCTTVLTCYRQALEGEVPMNLERIADDRVNYANLMYATGFFKEALPYFEKARKDFPRVKEFGDHITEIQEYIKIGGGTGKLSMRGFYKMPVFMSELGVRQRVDELIERVEPDFWNEAVIGFSGLHVQSELVSQLIPQEAK